MVVIENRARKEEKVSCDMNDKRSRVDIPASAVNKCVHSGVYFDVFKNLELGHEPCGHKLSFEP